MKICFRFSFTYKFKNKIGWMRENRCLFIQNSQIVYKMVISVMGDIFWNTVELTLPHNAKLECFHDTDCIQQQKAKYRGIIAVLPLQIRFWRRSIELKISLFFLEKNEKWEIKWKKAKKLVIIIETELKMMTANKLSRKVDKQQFVFSNNFKVIPHS